MHIFVNWLIANDRNLFSFINGKMRNRILDAVMPNITHLGGATVTLSTLLILILFGTQEIRLWGVEALISLSVSHIFVQVIKKISGRKRPYMIIPDTRIFSNPLVDYSFPSGHTTSSFAIATAFSLHSASLAIILLPLAVVIGTSRVYLGLHYPTDCIVGAFLGMSTSIIIFNIFPVI